MPSASDFTRFVRMNGDKSYADTLVSNVDIYPTSPKTVPDVSTNTPKFHGIGTTKYRRPASYWTNYIASQNATFGKQPKVTKACDCTDVE